MATIPTNKPEKVKYKASSSKFIPWDSQPLAVWAEKYATGQFIDLDGKNTHYVVKGSGPPVILIHGFAFDLYTWTRNIDALAEQFTVYAFDLWGFGYSTRLPFDYGYPLYVEQLRLFMDALAIPQAMLIGHSIGGGIVIAFTVQNPSRVSKIVLVGSNGMPYEIPLMGKLLALRGVGEFAFGLNIDFIRRNNLERFWVADKSHITDAYFAEQSRFEKVQGSTAVLLACLRRNFFHKLPVEIQQLTTTVDIPKLLVWGKQDALVPLHLGQAMHTLLPDSRLEVVVEAGHLINYEAADYFNGLVNDFLA